MLDAVLSTNKTQPEQMLRLLKEQVGNDLKGKRVTVLGVAFKPGTDDVRESPALPIIAALVKEGAKVTAHDPIAVQTGKKALADFGVPESAYQFQPKLDDALAQAEAVTGTP